ncbi:hypothetical protein FS837_012096 [Tulasnella sp. UAMH 9824]|nr:hypothetical protein FS837_012096 [Tulasnella sp. UAMH 9824]
MTTRRIHFTARNTVFIDDELYRILGTNHNNRGNQYFALDYEFSAANRKSSPPTGGPLFYFNQDGTFYFDNGRGRRFITSCYNETWEEDDRFRYTEALEEDDQFHYGDTLEEVDQSPYGQILEEVDQSIFYCFGFTQPKL